MSVFRSKANNSFSDKKISDSVLLGSRPSTDQKANELSRKLTNSFTQSNKKQSKNIKIGQANFRESLINICHQTLGSCEGSSNLLVTITKYLQTPSESFDSAVYSLIVQIEYKKQTFDMSTQLKHVQREIIEEVVRKKHPVHKMIYQIWYKYMASRYDPTSIEKKLVGTKVLKNRFAKDTNAFCSFICNAIYYLFASWFYVVQKKTKNLYNKLYGEFIPNLVTMHAAWEPIYKNILICFGQTPSRLNRNQKPEDPLFDIAPQFSCQHSEKKPFADTVEVMNGVYSQYVPKRKIDKLKKLALTVKQQIKEYQEKLIAQKKLKEEEEADVDNQATIYAYAILKCGRDGVNECLDYLEMFYYDEASDSSPVLNDNGVNHLMTTIRMGALYLKQEDEKLDQ